MFLPGYVLLILLQAGGLSTMSLPESSRIMIVDGGKSRPVESTNFDERLTGPSTGQMLNHHYFPAINDYNAGRFNMASKGFTYAINSPHYLDGNPRKAEFLSTAYYGRAMIWLYHAEGVGRHLLAKNDFESAIKLNPMNHMAYLELSRVYSNLGFFDQAASVIDTLLDLKPSKDIQDEAQAELTKLSEKKTQQKAQTP